MKKLVVFAFMVFSMNAFTQTIKRIDKQTQLIKRECDFAIITTDSMTTSTLRSMNEALEEVSCYSSHSTSTAIMFWFHIDSIERVQQNLNNLLGYFIVE